MRTILIAAVAALALALPTEARADLFVTPYAGVNFGGSTVSKRLNFGGSLTWLGASGVGLEADMGFIPDFFAATDTDADLLGDNSVTTVMANVVYAPGRRGFQPYVSAGAGLLRSRVGTFDELFETTNNGFGVNAGAGLRIGGGRLGLRGDVRYFRNLTDVDELILEDVLGEFSFWRATGGLTVRF